MSATERGYMQEHGLTLAGHGYDLVKIPPGKKHPNDKGWQTKDYVGLLKDNDRMFSGDGVGIRTAHAPAIDVDILDVDVAEEMTDFIDELIGQSPVRVGREPRRLHVFSVGETFKKMASVKYVDTGGNMQQIEILGDGQQFVAYAIHPGTGKPRMSGMTRQAHHWTRRWINYRSSLRNWADKSLINSIDWPTRRGGSHYPNAIKNYAPIRKKPTARPPVPTHYRKRRTYARRVDLHARLTHL